MTRGLIAIFTALVFVTAALGTSAGSREADFCAAADNSYAPLIIFTGESNSGGLAPNSALSSSESPPRRSVQILNNATLTIQTMQIGVNNLIAHTGLIDNATHGWENELANAAEAGRFNQQPIFLVKTGQGGSVIT
jgi:hypothetical protein